jgi:hypothetical protein
VAFKTHIQTGAGYTFPARIGDFLPAEIGCFLPALNGDFLPTLTLKSSTGNFEYFTSADISSYWSNTDLEAVSVEESELPN